jgi:hypothetical protein
MKTAILSDRPPDAHGQGGFDERGFIYIELLQRDGDRNELRDYFEGRSDDPSVLRDHDIRIDAREVIGRGSLDQPGRKVLWLASRGRVQMSRAARDGLTALTLIECQKSDNRGRLGIWFGPDPDLEASLDELELAGTPADPAAIDAFLAPFSLCPA